MFGRRLIMIALGALLGGAALGRRSLDRAVEHRVAVEIERAKELAMRELDTTVEIMLRKKLREFMIVTGIKATVIGCAWLLFRLGYIGDDAMHWIALAIIALFLTRDAVITLPFLTPALRLARRHGWRLRRALSEFVAGHVFEKAYAQALLEVQSGPGRFWVALSTYSAESISRDVAAAVSDLARHTSFDRIWPRVALALVKWAALVALYLTFLAVTIGLG